MVLVFLSSGALLFIMATFVIMTLAAYEVAISLANSILEALPVVTYAAIGILLVASIIYAIVKRYFWAAPALFFSFAKTICFVLLAVWVSLTTFIAGGNVFMSVFALPFGMLAGAIPLGIDLFVLSVVWDFDYMDEDDLVHALVVSLIEMVAMVALLLVLSLFM